MVTYQALRTSLTAQLHAAGIPAASTEASFLCQHVSCMSLGELLLHANDPADEKTCRALDALVARRIQGEPLQYLLGEWEFYGLTFAVGPGVLIPRQDTETIVELLRPEYAQRRQLRILDLCSGSGCLAICLQTLFRDAMVTAVELSDAALPYLRKNAARHNAHLSIVQGDVLDTALAAALTGFDLIVCNPPYLSGTDMQTLQREVTHEPALALTGGTDGLRFYRALPKIWRDSLIPGGRIVFEIGMGQENEVIGFLTAAGYADCQAFPDYSGILRVVTALTPKNETSANNGNR